jgi:hypothetical protein
VKKIIVVTGVSDRGKSETINEAYDILRSKYPGAEVKELFRRRKNTRDIKVLITINGVKIGIESQGDPKSTVRLFVSLPEFVDMGCEVIVCAAHENSITMGEVNKYAGEYQIVPLPHEKNIGSDLQQRTRNMKTAASIVAEIEKSLARTKAANL